MTNSGPFCWSQVKTRMLELELAWFGTALDVLGGAPGIIAIALGIGHCPPLCVHGSILCTRRREDREGTRMRSFASLRDFAYKLVGPAHLLQRNRGSRSGTLPGGTVK